MPKDKQEKALHVKLRESDIEAIEHALTGRIAYFKKYYHARNVIRQHELLRERFQRLKLKFD